MVPSAGVGSPASTVCTLEHENFSACWPDDQLKAKGAVAQVAELIPPRPAEESTRLTGGIPRRSEAAVNSH